MTGNDVWSEMNLVDCSAVYANYSFNYKGLLHQQRAFSNFFSQKNRRMVEIAVGLGNETHEDNNKLGSNNIELTNVRSACITSSE